LHLVTCRSPYQCVLVQCSWLRLQSGNFELAGSMHCSVSGAINLIGQRWHRSCK
jgi:hypothetical protein